MAGDMGDGRPMRRHPLRRVSARQSVVAVALTATALLSAGAGVGVPARPESTATSTARTTVQVYLPRGSIGPNCRRVLPRPRRTTGPAVLRGAMEALVEGPTAAEAARGYDGWFSRRTAGRVRSVRIVRSVARIDFRDFSRIIPNASTSCGSALLLAQLNRTALQFPTVTTAVYSFDGSVAAFYDWLQLSRPGT